MKNAENPGTFSVELNNLYEKNHMRTLNLEGFEPPKLSTIDQLFIQAQQSTS